MNYQSRFKWLWLPIILLLATLLPGCGLPETAVSSSTSQPINIPIEADQAVAAELEVTAPPSETTILPRSDVQSPINEVNEDALANLFSQEQAFVSVYEKVNPAVVNIRIGSGQGSGFLFDNLGHIVTNNHVVAAGGTIVVRFDDGRELPATVVGTDPSSDLAVIQVNSSRIDDITPVTLADSDELKVGQIAIAIGSPFGLQSSMTTGIISALDRLFPGAVSPDGTVFQIPDIIQTDAAINPGNSGGPLLNLGGQVIGVNTAIESPVRGSSGIGYAIPANIVRNIVPQIIANGRVETPWLGISGGPVTEDVATAFGLSTGQTGILINQVIAGGPAAAAGLRGGNMPDIIIGVDGREIVEFDDLLGYLVQQTVVGQTIQLKIVREGQEQTVGVTLAARPASG